ncbi:hypothetical protein RSOLAG1IB_07559 [Rhizoctonia solani AG-1 IB]|uniref:Uncharacterized protein n=1 Tax=Thanatephorus cucumeris (strain AG1-IB / isolate 7/3/14) TaxID=1108050 RepID=A0A0B7FDL3_THACB|nr:hypothetical protein RSOLAG1IB_07559 [Rhizoctonia solani AG-1 IB]
MLDTTSTDEGGWRVSRDLSLGVTPALVTGNKNYLNSLVVCLLFTTQLVSSPFAQSWSLAVLHDPARSIAKRPRRRAARSPTVGRRCVD